MAGYILGWLVVSTTLIRDGVFTHKYEYQPIHLALLAVHQELSHKGFQSYSQLPIFLAANFFPPHNSPKRCGRLPRFDREPDSQHGNSEGRLWKMLEDAFTPGKCMSIIGFCLQKIDRTHRTPKSQRPIVIYVYIYICIHNRHLAQALALPRSQRCCINMVCMPIHF